MNETLQNQISALLSSEEEVFDMQKLFGEASARQYFRVKTTRRSLIAMLLPEGAQSVAEEITKTDPSFILKELPFLNVQRYLQCGDIAVPAVFAQDATERLILLEDLGEISLEKCVAVFSAREQSEQRLNVYKKAIDVMLEMQSLGEKRHENNCIAFHRRFSSELFLWELEHFREYGIEDRFQLQVNAEVREKLRDYFTEIAQKLAALPFGLTHRDFQSRNLMLHQDRFYVIDFQDALLGPPHYDLVALLRDSYIDLSASERHELIHYYLARRTEYALSPLDAERFWHDFALMTLQRKLKDAGRFQFIATVKSNPNFLPYVTQTLSYVKEALAALPEYRDLQALLAQWVPELR